MDSLKVNHVSPTRLPSHTRGEKWTLSTLTSAALSAPSHTKTSQGNSGSVNGISRQ